MSTLVLQHVSAAALDDEVGNVAFSARAHRCDVEGVRPGEASPVDLAMEAVRAALMDGARRENLTLIMGKRALVNLMVITKAHPRGSRELHYITRRNGERLTVLGVAVALDLLGHEDRVSIVGDAMMDLLDSLKVKP